MVARNRVRTFFWDFGYKVIRLKYFIMIVAALILEITTLTIYLLKIENVVEFEVFSISLLYGATSAIIVVMAAGILVLMKTDKKRDRNKIRILQNFKSCHRQLANKYSNEINNLVKRFDSETSSIDIKINYAIVLEEKYGKFLEEFSRLKTPPFLSYAHNCESEHLSKERQFYSGFSMFSKPDILNRISTESDTAHRNFLKEVDKLEKSLKLII